MKKFKPKKKAIIAPKTKNGAKGISVFIEYFFEKIRSTIPTKAPVQKAKTKPESPCASPKSQPKPKASFASPSPIQTPLEKSQIKAKGRAINNPDKSSKIEGKCGAKTKPENKNKPIKDKIPKSKTKTSGIILCLKS